MKTEFRTDSGVWMEKFTSAEPTPEDQSGAGQPNPPVNPRLGSAPDRAMLERYGLVKSSAAEGAATGGAAAPKPKTPGATNEVTLVTVTFRAVSLTSVQPEANKRIAFAVLTELQNSPLFDRDKTEFVGTISSDEPPGTFTFPVTLALKRTLKL